MRVGEVLTEAEREAIRRATVEAEARTSGEIVVTVVESCDAYEGALWKAATLGALLVPLALGLWRSRGEVWDSPAWVWLALPAFLGAVLGFLAPLTMPTLHRLLIGRRTLERRVERRAAEAFISEGVFETADRCGVLLFIGLFEHRVEILRDRGAEAGVPPESWEDLAERLAAGLRRGSVGPALVTAVEDAGRLLELHGFVRRDDDRNELPDEVRLHED